jgi:hypothetical protein
MGLGTCATAQNLIILGDSNYKNVSGVETRPHSIFSPIKIIGGEFACNIDIISIRSKQTDFLINGQLI